MIWIVGSVLYSLVALVAARVMAGHFAYAMGRNAEQRYSSLHKGNTNHPNGEQWFGAWSAALALAVVWPVVVFVVLLPTRRIALGAERQSLLAQSRARVSSLEEKNAALEKRLGL